MPFSAGRKTRQGLIAIARSLYGSFAGKVEPIPSPALSFSVKRVVQSRGVSVEAVIAGHGQSVEAAIADSFSVKRVIQSHGKSVEAEITGHGQSVEVDL
jgi:hypothetical protein